TRPIGEIFISLLFMPIVPLVFASVTLGVSKLGGAGAGTVGRIAMKTILYFLITTAFAAAIGLVLVNLIRPGEQFPEQQRTELMAFFATDAPKTSGIPPSILKWVTGIVPRNPAEAFVNKQMLPIIFTAILVGFALLRLPPDKACSLTDFLEAVNLVCEQLIRWAMVVAPYGVFALLFGTTALFGIELLKALGIFMLTVLLGLAIQLFVVFPPLVATLGGMHPMVFFRKSFNTMMTAFSTSSSSATLPSAMKCAEEELGVPGPVAKFVLPLSASMNHNGTALFEGVTVMFLIQAFGQQLSIVQQIEVLGLCVLTATGMAGVPGGSLPLIGLILERYGVPPGAIALIIGVDRLLDMSRTMVNVTGDLTTAVYVGRGEKALESDDPEVEK
ncbi:MAG: dicarboxylate/amino acid:cation symporter, partial [Gemmataceae bacterium]